MKGKRLPVIVILEELPDAFAPSSGLAPTLVRLRPTTHTTPTRIDENVLINKLDIPSQSRKTVQESRTTSPVEIQISLSRTRGVSESSTIDRRPNSPYSSWYILDCRRIEQRLVAPKKTPPWWPFFNPPGSTNQPANNVILVS